MNTLLEPIYSGHDVLEVARIDQVTLANWLRRGLLDRLGTTVKPEGKRRKYSALDILTITAEAQLAFLGIAQNARNETRISEHVAGKCMQLLTGAILPGNIDNFRYVTVEAPAHNLGVKVVIDCKQIADYVKKELEAQ